MAFSKENIADILNTHSTRRRVLQLVLFGLGNLALEKRFVDPPSKEQTVKILLPIPTYQQKYGLSCESASALMIARYLGVDTDEDQILFRFPYHPNPHIGFRQSDVNGLSGGIEEYGVYSGPIANALCQFNINAEPVDDMMAADWRKVLQNNQIGIAWLIYRYASPYQPHIYQNIEGQEVKLVPWEHAVAVVGFIPGYIIVNDPGDGSRFYYPDEMFDQVTSHFNGMSVLVSI